MERLPRGKKCKEIITLLVLALIGTVICIWPLKSIITQTTLGATTSNELKTSGGMVVSVDHLSKSEEGKYFVLFTLMNEKGMSQGIEHIASAWIINVDANGYKYRLLQKQTSQDVHIIEKTDKKITYMEEAKLCKKVNNKWIEVQDELSVMDGKTGYLSAGTFYLYSEKQILKDDITRYINMEEAPRLTTFTKMGLIDRSISLENKAGEEAKWMQEQSNLYRPIEILESQGLKASIYTEPNMFLDSIGYVNGKLHMITSKVSEGKLYFLVTNREGKKLSTVYITDYSKDLEYQVVDIRDLTDCQVEAIHYISYGEEKAPGLDLKVPFKIIAR